MEITMTRGEVMDLLGVNNDRMKNITRNGKLEENLNVVGYAIVKSYKIGRNTIYDLKKITVDVVMDILKHNKINKTSEFIDYCKYIASYDCCKKSKADIISDIGISNSTSKRYDEMFEKAGIIRLIYRNINNYKIDESDPTNVVYRYIDKNHNMLYVGKASNLKTRTYQHMIDNKEDDWNKTYYKLEYIEFNTYDDCSFAEMYFISKLNPKYNKDMSDLNITMSIGEFDNLTWSDYKIDEYKSKHYTIKKGDRFEEFKECLDKNY